MSEAIKEVVPLLLKEDAETGDRFVLYTTSKGVEFELCFEDERWFDLQRWDALEPGKMNEILNAFVNYLGDSQYNWDPKYRLYPIPITEIAKVPEGVLTQNPGF